MSGYIYSFHNNYEETVSNYDKLYKYLQNLDDVLKETGIKYKI